LTGIAAVQPL